MRNMAYTVTINSILPIEKKDNIVYIGFKENGYHVIGDKSFKIGEVVAYFEVDSILPVRKEFEFLRKRCYKENLNGFLIKNMKMCGLYSTGLILHQSDVCIKKTYNADKDLTDILNIKKYEPEEDSSPKNNNNIIKNIIMKHKITRFVYNVFFNKHISKKEFPTWLIDKSDETNIQNHKDWFDKCKDVPCYISTKMEGQSCTMLFTPYKNKLGNFCVYGRNTTGSEKMWNLAKQINAEQKLKKAYNDTGHIFAVQGERCAPDVQKGIYKNGEHFYVYTIKDLTDNKLLDFDDFIEFCNEYNFEHVPILYSDINYSSLFNFVEEMQEFTEHQWFNISDTGFISYDDRNKTYIKIGESHRHEGIVVRGYRNEFSFKVKSNEYQIAGL